MMRSASGNRSRFARDSRSSITVTRKSRYAARAYLIPLFDQLLAWILQAIEVKKGKLLVKQTECEKEISDIAILIDQPPTNQIGFQIPLIEEEMTE